MGVQETRARPVVAAAAQPLHLRDLRIAEIDDDGNAKLILATTGGDLTVTAPLGAIMAAGLEMARVGHYMLRLQLNHIDRGRSAFEEMAAAALQPATISVAVNPNATYTVVYRFTERMPVVVQISAEQMAKALADLDAEMQAVAN